MDPIFAHDCECTAGRWGIGDSIMDLRLKMAPVIDMLLLQYEIIATWLLRGLLPMHKKAAGDGAGWLVFAIRMSRPQLFQVRMRYCMYPWGR